jgi:hypothetical protein
MIPGRGSEGRLILYVILNSGITYLNQLAVF